MLRLDLYLSLIPLFAQILKELVVSNEDTGKLKSDKRLKLPFASLLLILVIQLVIGLFQFIQGKDLGLEFLGESKLLSGTINTSFMTNSLGLFLRSYGTFPHPNVLAGFVLALLIFGYIFFFAKKKAYFFTLFFIAGLLVMFTFSRTIIVLYFLFLLFAIYNLYKGRLFSIFPLFLDRFLNLNLGETSVVDRVKLLKASWEIFKNNWLIGVGNNKFISNLDPFNITTSNGLSLLQPVHNVVVLVLVEHGLFGGLFVLLYIGYLKVKTSLSYLTNTGLFIYSCFVIFLIGMLDHYLFTLPQGVFILTLLLML